jgi:hypothetical protein
LFESTAARSDHMLYIGGAMAEVTLAGSRPETGVSEIP